MQYYDEQPLHMPPMVEAPYGFGIMQPYYGPQYGFNEPPSYVITLPRCKVCQDAGKSPKEFHSHWVRESKDPNSRVTCPTLLSLSCNYCKKKGHTIKYCYRLKNKDLRYAGTKHYMLTHTSEPEEGEDFEDIDTNTMSTLSDVDDNNDW